MYQDINNYIKSCILCAQFNPRCQKPPGTLKPIKSPDGVWQLVSMDFHGPINPTSQCGNKYIISFTDILSKFVVTKAGRDNTAHYPIYIKLIGMINYYSLYLTTILQFTRQPNTNVTLSYDTEHMKKLNKFLSNLNEQAKCNIIKHHQQYRQHYNRNRSNPLDNIGDLVLVKTLNIRYKFDLRYEGSYRIIKKITDKTFIIQHVKKPTSYRQVTTDMLLPIFERIY
ncbi:unnamed protein product [Rotaria magnacalcarata]|uniref:Uncharacterized protein n=2 Tax=Rotaria magnacalcarata TaxID=392030 RepID=A0A819NP14_9BILA|nr:unnamed protein product [Rotaria magnacalcarata]